MLTRMPLPAAVWRLTRKELSGASVPGGVVGVGAAITIAGGVAVAMSVGSGVDVAETLVAVAGAGVEVTNVTLVGTIVGAAIAVAIGSPVGVAGVVGVPVAPSAMLEINPFCINSETIMPPTMQTPMRSAKITSTYDVALTALVILPDGRTGWLGCCRDGVKEGRGCDTVEGDAGCVVDWIGVRV